MKKYFIVRSRATPVLEEFIIPLTSEAIYIWKGKEWIIQSNSIVIPPENLKVIVDLLYSKCGVSNIICTMLFYRKDTLIISALIPQVGLLSAITKIIELESLQQQVLVKIVESVKHEEKLTKLHIPVTCRDEIVSYMKRLDQMVEIFPFKNR